MWPSALLGAKQLKIFETFGAFARTRGELGGSNFLDFVRTSFMDRPARPKSLLINSVRT